MRVPFLDLKGMSGPVRDEISKRMTRVLDRSDFVLGEDVAKFERNFAEFCDCNCAVGLASGLDAIKLALRALNIGPGDEVITVANSFIATALAISSVGATPVLVDMAESDYAIDVSKLDAALTERTRAVMPVHLYGQMADMDPIVKFAECQGLAVIEDACQAHGAAYKGRRAGSIGDIAAFSFYPGKNLGAYGDGGMAVTNSKVLAEESRMLRNYGSIEKYHHDSLGENSRLDTIQAAVLDVKLKYLNAWNDARRTVASQYVESLSGVGDLVLPRPEEGREHVYHLFVIRTEKRDALLQYLGERGVQALIHYPIPIHLQKAYSDMGWSEGDYPVTERCAKQILSLPIFPTMTDGQIEYVVEQVRAFFGDV